ncbi:MAG TPA: DEAD/DEAH box helicase, partial [Candidatus Competibacteraceae bacterium]|nr:DEAD/DEAH box helicase [Candidatus Competibacteraceae bacterium]
MANQVAAGEYPAVLAIPTGCGKTTVIDIWGWALSQALPVPVPRRLYWCIDRRVVVAQTARFAEALATWVPGLQLAELRGGQSIDVDGIIDPSRPAILVTTVDQLGSRLLWRPYGGISHYVAPIHAGLVGNDALIVLDEAHLSEPMGKTLEAIKQLRGGAIPLSWHIMHLTATPREAGGFQLGEDDYADPILS